MPSSMLEVVRCTDCHGDHQRQYMSPFTGICACCYERLYTLCSVCGSLLRGTTSRSDAYFLQEDTTHCNPMCYGCWLHQCRRGDLRHWHPTPLDSSIATYKRMRSKRKYGVEVETTACANFEDLFEKTRFGCKGDCSIIGREFDSPILYGDEGFAEIEALLRFGSKQGWTATDNCGCHTHYDMRDETDDELYRVAYAYAKTYTFWSRSVSDARRGNTYCHRPSYNASDIRASSDRGLSFASFCRGSDRYDYVNLMAYPIHCTFEVRLLEGTVDASTICNWVSLHARFIDYVKELSYDDLDYAFAGQPKHIYSALLKIVDDSALTGWLCERVNHHSPALLT